MTLKTILEVIFRLFLFIKIPRNYGAYVGNVFALYVRISGTVRLSGEREA